MHRKIMAKCRAKMMTARMTKKILTKQADVREARPLGALVSVKI
jgi:hypothetical protein